MKTATRNFCLRVTYLQQVSGLPGSGNDGAGGECLNGEIILQPEGGPDNQSEAGRNHYNTTTYRPPAPLTIAPTLNEYREVPLMRYNLERP